MARLYSDFPLSGTFGNLTIYKVGSKCYVRTKSSLDRRRFQKDPAFAKSREKAALFGAAARLVKAFYAELPKEVKCHGLFGKLTALAYKGLQGAKTYEAIVEELKMYCGVEQEVKSIVVTENFVPLLPLPVQEKCIVAKRPSLSTWWVTDRGMLEKRALVYGSSLMDLEYYKGLLYSVLTDG